MSVETDIVFLKRLTLRHTAQCSHNVIELLTFSESISNGIILGKKVAVNFRAIESITRNFTLDVGELHVRKRSPTPNKKTVCRLG